MAKAKTPARPSSHPSPPRGAPEDVRGELRQLAELRQRFPALPENVAAALLAHHDEESCRAKGTTTRAADTFRGAMTWARTFGAHAGDPALSPVRVRWFLDCLTALGSLLTGRTTAPNPADESALDDAAQAADKLLRRAERRARDAAGTNKSWQAALDRALTPDEVLDPRTSRLRQLATLLESWLGADAASAPPLGAYDLDAKTVASLRDAAERLDAAIARRPAPQQADRDSPAVNAAEGRLYFVMRSLWDDLAEAREDGRTSLQLTVSPALLRGLNLNARNKRKDPPGPTPA